MSAIAGLVDVTKSMIVVDANKFPVNLQKVYREDLPDATFKILAYEARNVMPTALGYRSYFSDYTVLGIQPVPSAYCQWVLSFQTADYSTILIAACEEGLWWCGATQGVGATAWQQLVQGYDVNPNAPVFHLWTHAVIANRLFVYCQGQEKFYCFGSIADVDNLVSAASNYSDAKVVKAYESAKDYKFAFASVVPTFLNMKGQIGLFRADNRLGFWDSDNAVAWSSALYVGDFEPSTETFAGVTTFADVVGAITMIYGHGNDFVIYSTRSIVQAKNVEGSNEKWAGSAILSDTGVSFYNQIAPGQPDTTHYALTSSGLCRIQNTVPQFFETEVSDYLMENNDYYALSYIDGRYLFMHSANDLVPSVVQVDAEKVVDKTNGTYYFVPTTNNESAPLATAVKNILSGSDSAVQYDFNQTATPVDAADAGAAAGATGQKRTLVPCYTGGEFGSSWDDDAAKFKLDRINSFYPESEIIVDTTGKKVKLAPGSFYDLDVNPIVEPELTLDDPNNENRFIDKAGDDFQEILTKNIVNIHKVLQKYVDLLSYAKTGVQVSASPANIPTLRPEAVPAGFTGGTLLGDIPLKQMFKREIKGLIKPSNLKWTMNNCTYTCTLLRKTTLKLTAKFSGFEMLNLNIAMIAVDGYGYGFGLPPDYILQTKARAKGYYVAVDLDLFTKQEYQAMIDWWKSPEAKERFDVDMNRAWSPESAANIIAYCILKVPSRIISTGPSGATLKAFWDDCTTIKKGYESVRGDYAEWTKGGFQNPGPSRKYGRIDPVSQDIEGFMLRFYEVTLKNISGSVTTIELKPEGEMNNGYHASVISTGEVFLEWDSPGLPMSHPEFMKMQNCRVKVTRPDGSDYEGDSGIYTLVHTVIPGIPDVEVDYPIGVSPSGGVIVKRPIGNSWGVTELGPAPSVYEGQLLISQIASRKPRSAWYMGGTITFDVEEVDEEDLNIDIFKADNSGWGYFQNWSFTKTHSRGEGSSVCIPGNYNSTQNPQPTPEDAGAIGNEPIITLPTTPGIPDPTAPSTWPYPEPVKIPDIAALFRKGTPAPFYPTYEAAVVYDFLLEKYGRYSNKHKQIFSLLPTNRADSTVTPVKDLGLRGGFLRPDGQLGYFSPDAPDSEIVYGRFGSYRLGVTRGTKVVARFGEETTGTLIVECSLDGATVDRSLTQSLEFKKAVTVEFFFTRTAKWFNIRIRGKFDLVGLSFESDPRGRR